jgi:hypothetical protein
MAKKRPGKNAIKGSSLNQKKSSLINYHMVVKCGGQIVVKRHNFNYFLPHLNTLKSVDFTHFLRIYQLLLLPQQKLIEIYKSSK